MPNAAQKLLVFHPMPERHVKYIPQARYDAQREASCLAPLDYRETISFHDGSGRYLLYRVVTYRGCDYEVAQLTDAPFDQLPLPEREPYERAFEMAVVNKIAALHHPEVFA